MDRSTINAKKNRANALLKAMRDAIELAESEKRTRTPEEEALITGNRTAWDALRVEIENDEALLAAEERTAQPATRGHRPELDDNDNAQCGRRSTPEYRAAFRKYLYGGERTLTTDEARMLAPSAGEARALQADVDVAGGYLVAPEQYVAQVIKAMDNQVFMRTLANPPIQLAQAQSLGVPTLDADPADADWTAEITTVTQDSTMATGKRELTPHLLSKELDISMKLLRAGAIDVESFSAGRLGYKFGVTLEKAYLTGNGAGQPLGVFTASASGISTGRDVSTGNTTTTIEFDGLINAKYSIKGQYWSRLSAIFHRDGVKQLATKKDGDGQYIWRESTRVGEPSTVLGMPVYMSEYAPNTFTTGLYVGVIGDFRAGYWIVDALDMQIQRLDQLVARTNQVAYIGRLESDGAPVLEEAFARIKLA